MKRSLLLSSMSALCLLHRGLLAQDISLTPLGSYREGAYNEGAAEIVAHDPAIHRLFVFNGAKKTVDILNGRNPLAITRIGNLAIPTEAGAAVALFTTQGAFPKSFTVGALPDMVTFAPDGNYILSANEGEPAEDYSVDPEGSISVIDISKGIEATTQADVKTAGFKAFTLENLPAGIRVFGPSNRP